MKWDYLAVTLNAARDGSEELRQEVDRWRCDGWRLEDVWSGGFDASGADAEDEQASRVYTCVFRRPTGVQPEQPTARARSGARPAAQFTPATA